MKSTRLVEERPRAVDGIELLGLLRRELQALLRDDAQAALLEAGR